MHTYLNKITKKLIITFILFAITTCNTAFAVDEYFKINSLLGKSININLSTIEIKDDIVTFSTKYLKDYDKDIIIRFAINVDDKTSKKLKQDIFDKKGNLLNSTDYSNKNQFKPIKDGTLMADLYDVAVTVKNSSEAFSKNSKAWNKYFKEVANNINRKYHPNILRWKQGLETEDKDVLIMVLVDKNGKIISYKYENKYPVKYPKFDKKYKEHVEKIFLKNNKIFPPLPKEYNGDKIIIRFRICYNVSGKSNYKNYYKQGIEKFYFDKKSMPLCYLPLWTITLTKCVGVAGITIISIPFSIIAPDATDNITSKIYDKF